MNESDLFLQYLNKRIELLTDSYIGVKSHEISVEASNLRIEVKVLKQIREKYLSILSKTKNENL